MQLTFRPLTHNLQPRLSSICSWGSMLGTAQVNLSDVCLCVVGEVIMYVTFTVSCIFEHMDLCTCKHLCLCVNLMVCCKVYALLYV